MSRLVEFYRSEATDAEGRFLKDVWAWEDGELEAVHDFIQWLFPLPEPSRFNPDAPLLTEEDVAAFRSDPLLQANLRQSFVRMLAFLGLSVAEDGGVVEGPHFTRRAVAVWSFPNHNWLRITRIMRSLRLLGLEAEARALYDRLDTLFGSRRFPIPADTFRYWTEAVRGLPLHD
ncbi:MAG TPA: opioid growth factor receptor-related protein [Gemmataceae bacterium]|nr:opioid growth factor receptor-related protein [Gemmataceae bacterium]